MLTEIPNPRTSLTRFIGLVLLLSLGACTHLSDTKPSSDTSSRGQLSIGYSLLYHEADGIPKLKWLLMFKDKPEEMGRLTHDLVRFYQQLADTMQKLSKNIPPCVSMRPPCPPSRLMSARPSARTSPRISRPSCGKTGIAFEREALLMFYNSLDEQRHLVAVMLRFETDPPLKQFLETTKTQLDQHYAKVAALLNRRYFAH